MDTDLPAVDFHVLNKSPPIFQCLFRHTQPDNKGQRRNHAHRSEWRDRGEGEDCGEEKIDIGYAAELLKEGFREESDNVVLGGGDVVVAVIEGLLAMEQGSVAVDNAGVTGTLEGGGLLII